MAKAVNKVTIPIGTIKKVALWIWENQGWIIPTVTSVYKMIKELFTKRKEKIKKNGKH